MPYTTEIDVRYRDLDTHGHVNNAVYATYVESARIGYINDVIGLPIGEHAYAIANLDMSFERPLELGDTVEATAFATSLGSSSVDLEYEVTIDGEPAATAETTLIHFDEPFGEPAPFPEPARERIEAADDL